MDWSGEQLAADLQHRMAPNSAVLLSPLLNTYGAAMARNFNDVGVPMVAVMPAQWPGCSPPQDRWPWVLDLVPETVFLVSIGPPGHERPPTCLQAKASYIGRVEVV